VFRGLGLIYKLASQKGKSMKGKYQWTGVFKPEKLFYANSLTDTFVTAVFFSRMMNDQICSVE